MELTKVISLFEDTTNKNEKTIDQSISDLFKGIFPNVWMMIATTIALILLLGILTLFVYKPLKKVIKERRDFIQNNIDDSIKKKEEAEKLEEQKNIELWEARIAAAQIISQAKMESEKIANQYTSNAKKEAKRILEDAHSSVSQMQKQFQDESREEIISVATKLASKVLEKHISHYENEELINKLLNETE